MHAKQAGIDVDPAVERLMAEAPVGTCWNDPTRDGCPTITAAIYSPAFFGLRDATATASKVDRRDQSGRVMGVKGRATSFLDRCQIKVNYGSPYAAAGYAQMDTQSYCSTRVSDNDDYLLLQKYDLNYGSWRSITSKWYDDLLEGKFHFLSLRKQCASNVSRKWRAQIDGYALLEGTMYAGTQSKEATIDCNYP